MGRSHQKSTFSTVFGIKGKGKKNKYFLLWEKKPLILRESYLFYTAISNSPLNAQQLELNL